MNIPLRRAPALLAIFIGSGVVAFAHPGHDGHELTWDFSHLADYPAATIGCVGLLIGTSWAAWLLLRRAATQRFYSLRGSQPSRGK
jgi:hypothetical protein